jgi:hypothetical protein
VSTVRATITFSLDRQGRLVAEITSDDPLAYGTLALAMKEFWEVDRENYDSANEAKWKRRLR